MKKKTTSERQQWLAETVCSYLLDNLDRKITLEDLADKYGYSATYIKICFKNTYGMPVHKYVRAKRLEYAAKELMNGTDGILEIAGKVGFENGSKFAKVFRDMFGMTPGKFRRLDRAESQRLLENVRTSLPKKPEQV